MTTAFTLKTPLLVAFIVIYLALTAYVTARFVIASNLGEPCRCAQLVDMIEGTAEKPYVYRALVPWVIKITDGITPNLVQEKGIALLLTAKDHPVTQSFMEKRSNLKDAFEDVENLHWRVSMLIVIVALLFGYVVALYKLARVLFPSEWALALFAPVVGLLLIPALSFPVLYVYDIGVLFLSAACFYALAAGRMRWYYVWFALACVNKETSVFLLLFFTLWSFPHMPLKRFFAHWSAQLLLFVVIRGAIYQTFAQNAGVFLREDYVDGQLVTFLSGYSYIQALACAAAVFLLSCNWQQKPLFARWGLAIFAMMFVAYILFGKPGEYRVFYDILPLLTMLVTHSLVSYTGISRMAPFQVGKT